MTDPARCCWLDQETHKSCDAVAEFEITDLADTDPYTSVTHACAVHLGQSMGHHSHLPDNIENRWEVRAL